MIALLTFIMLFNSDAPEAAQKSPPGVGKTIASPQRNYVITHATLAVDTVLAPDGQIISVGAPLVGFVSNAFYSALIGPLAESAAPIAPGDK